MLSKIKTKNQLTIPAEIMKKLTLKPGDDVELKVEKGKIVLTPIVTIEKEFWDLELAKEVKEEYEYYKKNPDEYKAYSSAKELFDDLEND